MAGINIASGFNLQSEQPLDNRIVVDTYADLNIMTTNKASYKGMQIYVKNEDAYYKFNGTNWVRFGDEPKFASTEQAGIMKLHKRGDGTNISGIIVNQDDGTAYIATNDTKGIRRDGAGQICVVAANEDEIADKSQIYKPIVPSNLDFAVKSIQCYGKASSVVSDANGALTYTIPIDNWQLKNGSVAYINLNNVHPQNTILKLNINNTGVFNVLINGVDDFRSLDSNLEANEIISVIYNSELNSFVLIGTSYSTQSGYAFYAGVLENQINIDGVNTYGNTNVNHYGTISNSNENISGNISMITYIVSINNWVLENGAIAYIRLNQSHPKGKALKLNINNTGAKEVLYNGIDNIYSLDFDLQKDEIISVVYDKGQDSYLLIGANFVDNFINNFKNKCLKYSFIQNQDIFDIHECGMYFVSIDSCTGLPDNLNGGNATLLVSCDNPNGIWSVYNFILITYDSDTGIHLFFRDMYLDSNYQINHDFDWQEFNNSSSNNSSANSIPFCKTNTENGVNPKVLDRSIDWLPEDGRILLIQFTNGTNDGESVTIQINGTDYPVYVNNIDTIISPYVPTRLAEENTIVMLTYSQDSGCLTAIPVPFSYLSQSAKYDINGNDLANLTPSIIDLQNKTKFANAQRAGIVKLLNDNNGNNISGIIVSQEDGDCYINANQSFGTTLTENGKVSVYRATQDEMFNYEDECKPITPKTISPLVQYSSTPQQIGVYNNEPIWRVVINRKLTTTEKENQKVSLTDDDLQVKIGDEITCIISDNIGLADFDYNDATQSVALIRVANFNYKSLEWNTQCDSVFGTIEFITSKSNLLITPVTDTVNIVDNVTTSAKGSIPINIDGGTAESLDVQNINGGNSDTIDETVYKSGTSIT